MEQPKWQEYMLPILKFLYNKKEEGRHSIVEAIAKATKLTEALKAETITNGEPRYSNRIGWALTYLKQSALINSPRRGVFSITERGKKTVDEKPKSLSRKDLEQYEEYQEFKKRKKQTSSEDEDDEALDLTPEEMIESAEKSIRGSVCSDLLQKARSISPSAFEDLVIDLIKKMGYGDENDSLSGLRIGGSGDGGIDGIIKEDKLGLDIIYIQAKRYKDSNSVSAGIVRDFIGALNIKGAKKGIIITTSSFTKEAIKHSEDLKEPRIVLIDGERLVELMYEFGIGVSEQKFVSIKSTDYSYFE